MASQKCICMGILVLFCLNLSSAHRLLIDSIDHNKPKEGGVGVGIGFGVGHESGSGAGGGGGFAGAGAGYGSCIGARNGNGYGLGGVPAGYCQPNYPDIGFGSGCPVSSCPCSCGGTLYSHSNSLAYLQQGHDGGMAMPSRGTNIGAHNQPISANAAKENQAVNQARIGQFEFAGNDGEPMPPNESAQKRNEMEDQEKMIGTPMVDDVPRN